MLNLKRMSQTLAAGMVVSMLSITTPQAADNTSSSTTSPNGAATQSNSRITAINGASAKSATVSSADQDRMKNIAEANYAEIRTGKLALEKSKNSEIQQFAQMMIDDHTKANAELQQLAQSKGITLPQATDFPHKAAAAGMNVLSGNAFDKAYINMVGQRDHVRTHKLLQDTMNNAQDHDLRAYAQKTLQAVDQHKQRADAIEQRLKSKNQ